MEPTEEISKKAEIVLEEVKEKVENAKEAGKQVLQEKFVIEEPVVKITFKRLLAYFIIYSFLGFIVETIFGILTKGVLESRQSCLFGPFCCIYGVGAALMIPGLQKFKKSNWGIFIAGAIEGSMVEYALSWIGEVFFKIKWWDYSNMPFNINGRITLVFTIFWGLLSLGLIRFINPYIEKIINKLSKKWYNILTFGFTAFLLADLLITAFGLKVFYTRLMKEHNLNIKDGQALMISDEIMDTKIVKALSATIFSDEKILKTFPNIKYEDENGKIVWIKDILTDIQPYYFKFSNKFKLK